MLHCDMAHSDQSNITSLKELKSKNYTSQSDYMSVKAEYENGPVKSIVQLGLETDN